MVRAKTTTRRFPYAKTGKNRAYCEIRVVQRYAALLVLRPEMIRFIREIAQDINPNLRFRVDALSDVQEAAEMFIIQLFQEENLFTLHRKRENGRAARHATSLPFDGPPQPLYDKTLVRLHSLIEPTNTIFTLVFLGENSTTLSSGP